MKVGFNGRVRIGGPLSFLALAFCLAVFVAACSEDETQASNENEAAGEQIPVSGLQRIDLTTPEGAVLAARKIQCSLVDGEAITYSWRGQALARVPGEPDRVLFKLEGMNVRQCAETEDAARGKGFRIVSREIMLYLDPETGEILRQWENPWTGQTVRVIHVSNDPVNGGTYVTTRNGAPLTWTGQEESGHWWQTLTIPLFYTNVLGGPYQDNIGGTYHATEMFNYFGSVDDLVDLSKNTADVSIGWVRMSDWLPWMEMRGRAGFIYMHSAGRKLNDWNELPDLIKDEIAANYPEYTSPPPLDDTRPNETSWTYFKKLKEKEQQASK